MSQRSHRNAPDRTLPTAHVYVKQLDERNRQRRQRDQQSRTSEESMKARERGFVTHFSGANQSKVEDQRRREVENAGTNVGYGNPRPNGGRRNSDGLFHNSRPGRSLATSVSQQQKSHEHSLEAQQTSREKWNLENSGTLPNVPASTTVAPTSQKATTRAPRSTVTRRQTLGALPRESSRGQNVSVSATPPSRSASVTTRGRISHHRTRRTWSKRIANPAELLGQAKQPDVGHEVSLESQQSKNSNARSLVTSPSSATEISEELDGDESEYYDDDCFEPFDENDQGFSLKSSTQHESTDTLLTSRSQSNQVSTKQQNLTVDTLSTQPITRKSSGNFNRKLDVCNGPSPPSSDGSQPRHIRQRHQLSPDPHVPQQALIYRRNSMSGRIQSEYVNDKKNPIGRRATMHDLKDPTLQSGYQVSSSLNNGSTVDGHPIAHRKLVSSTSSDASVPNHNKLSPVPPSSVSKNEHPLRTLGDRTQQQNPMQHAPPSVSSVNDDVTRLSADSLNIFKKLKELRPDQQAKLLSMVSEMEPETNQVVDGHRYNGDHIPTVVSEEAHTARSTKSHSYNNVPEQTPDTSRVLFHARPRAEFLPVCDKVRFEFKSTWGASAYVGLTGIQVFDAFGKLVTIPKDQLRLYRGETEITEPEEIRILGRLVDGTVKTTDPKHMWIFKKTEYDTSLIAETDSLDVSIEILFTKPVEIGSIEIWNYNKGRRSTMIGVKSLQVFVRQACADLRVEEVENWYIAVQQGLVKKGIGSLVMDSHSVFEFKPYSSQQQQTNQSSSSPLSVHNTSLRNNQHGSPASMRKHQHGSPSSAYRSQHGSPSSKYRNQHGSPSSAYRNQHGSPASLRNNQHGSPSSKYRSQHGSPTSLRNNQHGSPSSKYRSQHGSRSPPHMKEHRPPSTSNKNNKLHGLSEPHNTSNDVPNDYFARVPKRPEQVPVLNIVTMSEKWGKPNSTSTKNTAPTNLSGQAAQSSRIISTSVDKLLPPARQNTNKWNTTSARVTGSSNSNCFVENDGNKGHPDSKSPSWLGKPLRGHQSADLLDIDLNDLDECKKVSRNNRQRNKCEISPTTTVSSLRKSSISSSEEYGKTPAKSPMLSNKTDDMHQDYSSEPTKLEPNTSTDELETSEEILNRQDSQLFAQLATNNKSHSITDLDRTSPNSRERHTIGLGSSLSLPLFQDGEFVASKLCKGRSLRLNILSTWGDSRYVGLTAIEVLNPTGKCISDPANGCTIRAFPRNSEEKHGPSSIGNLIGNATHTCDGNLMWVAPLAKNHPGGQYIHIDLGTQVEVAMIRVWNYNKSREHSYRGVRGLQIFLDDNVVFRGEIAKAPGYLAPREQCCTALRFTCDKGILKNIQLEDEERYRNNPGNYEEVETDVLASIVEVLHQGRPSTGAFRTPREPAGTLEGNEYRETPRAYTANLDYQSPREHSLGGEFTALDSQKQSRSESLDIQRNDRYQQSNSKTDVCTNSTTFEEDCSIDKLVEELSNLNQRDNDDDRNHLRNPMFTEPRLKSPTRETASVEQSESKSVSPNSIANGMSDIDTMLEEELRTIDISSSTTEKNKLEHSSFDVTRFPIGRRLTLNILGNWGCEYFVGMNGLAVLVVDELTGEESEYYPPFHTMSVTPPDITEEHYERTLDKLTDGVNVTCSTMHMWMGSYSPNGYNVIQIDLKVRRRIAGIRIWNYNKNLEDTRRGVKWLKVVLDQRVNLTPPEPGVMVRKAPGISDFDFGQTIRFLAPADPSEYPEALLIYTPYCAGHGFNRIHSEPQWDNARYHPPTVWQDWETPAYPCGHVFKLEMNGTFGDPYYIGLNGIEMYDQNGDRIMIDASQVHGIPNSINCLANQNPIKTTSKRLTKQDTRVAQNLVNGKNGNGCGSSSWLAPLASTLSNGHEYNMVYILFNEPQTISMLKVWNYSKDPSRGVHELALHIDDLVVFRGELREAPHDSPSNIGNNSFSQSILMCNDTSMVSDNCDQVHYCGRTEQSVVLFNDGHIMGEMNPTRVNSNAPVNLELRPFTSVYDD